MIDRIKNVMEYKQLTKSAFAKAIGIDPSRMTHIFNGHNEPTLDMVRRILVTFPDIRSEWLISGVGGMLNTQSAPQSPPDEPAVTADTDFFASHQTSLFDTDASPEISLFETDSPTSPQVDVLQEPETEPMVPPVVEDAPRVVVPKAEPKTVAQSPRSRGRMAESNNAGAPTKRERISNPQGDKKIVRIVIFYDDRSFEEYHPN